MTRPMLRHTILFLLGLLALVLIACGSDPETVVAPDPTAPPTSATTSTAELPAVTPEATSTEVPTSPSSATTTQAVIPTVEGEKVPSNPEVERLGAVTMETLTFLTNELSPRASGTQEEVVSSGVPEGRVRREGVRRVDSALRGAVDIAVRTAPDGGRAARRWMSGRSRCG